MPSTDRNASESAPMNCRMPSKSWVAASSLLALGRVDAVVVRMGDRRRGDAEMHLFGAGIAHHLHDLARRRAAHDGIVHEHDALAFDHAAIGGVLHAHAEVADRLRRLDEGTPDIVIADDAELVGNAGFCGQNPSPRARRSPAPGRSRPPSRAVRARARPPWSCAHRRRCGRRRIRPREIDVFEDARPRAIVGKRLRLRAVFR